MTSKRILSVVLCGSMFLSGIFPSGVLPAMAQSAANANDKLMDDLLGPIALYPDPLLAQVLACTTSPQQVTEVSTWLKMQDKELQGSQLQEAASAKGFDASFTAIVLFPDVLDTMMKNMQWTTEVGKAFLSDQKSVLESVQRLRKKAQMMGNLKTTPQQEVKTETQSGQQVIIVQPANPQVVYVPVYSTQVVYTTPPPPPAKDNSDVAAAAVIGFMVGVAIASTASPYPYGWSAWGVGWHSSTVVVVGGAWHVPPGRYVYTKPMPYGAYRPPTNVYAPTYNVNNVNVNVNNSTNINNVNNSKNVSTTPRPTTQPTTQPAARPTTTAAATPAATSSLSSSQTAAAQQRASSASATAPTAAGYSGARPATGASAAQTNAGTSSSALSGYQNKSSTNAASTRGQRSVSGGSASGGGARRR